MKDLEPSSRTLGSLQAEALTFGDVDAAVEAFEDARASDRSVSLRLFLPDREAQCYLETLQELVRTDLDHRFRETGSASLEDYRDLWPELFESPEAIAPLAFEEYRLRLSSPQPVSAIEYARKYRLDTSRWPTPGAKSSTGAASSALDAGARVELSPGQRVLDFAIVGELGRGAFSRVYLAKQISLSERPVVLKVSSVRLREAERLARLQHTNIVPVYSVHDYQKYSVLCMPWFGSTTLKDVIRSLRPEQSMPTSDSRLTGQMLLSTVMACESRTLTDLGSVAVDRRQPSTHAAQSANDASRSPLLRMDLEQAAVWVVMKLAEGLAHAHVRGILHRDLKPANVLLTEDGQPMILDFNLAVGQEDISEALAGGTLPYMSPEQIASVETFRPLDAASDVYSLGVMLYELLAGRLPFAKNSGGYREMIDERWQNIPQVRDVNPRLSVDVNSIVTMCLQPDVSQRYSSAADLAEDLDRHLRDLPLRHAANRSIPERAVKWVKRHPQVTSSTGILVFALAFIAVLGVAWWRSDVRLAREIAERQVSDFFDRKSSLQAEAFEAAFGEASRPETASLLESAIAPFRSPQFSGGAFDYGTLSASKRQQLSDGVAEIDFLAQALKKTSDLESSVQLESSPIVDAGVSDLAAMSDLERVRAATMHVLQRDFEAASEILSPITRTRPDDFAASLLHGMSLMEISQGGSLDGEALLTAAIAKNPDCVNAWYQRGVCRIALKKFDGAADDFSKVVDLNPAKLNAVVSRAICFKNLGRYEAAIVDLSKAIDGGFPETRVYFLRESVYRLVKDSVAADSDKATGLRLVPTDARSWVSRGLAQLPGSPEAAIADFREAQKLDPQDHDAFRNLASVLSEYLKKPDEAIAVQGEALRFYPRDAYLWVGRAVLHARAGRREQAIQDATFALSVSKEPLVIYSAACVYALTSEKTPEDANMALKLLADSIREENSLAGMAPTDQDLKPIIARPEFRNILAAAQILNPPVR